ncbi:MAG: hypothetical protein ACRCSC_05165 [Lactococcus garvieae]
MTDQKLKTPLKKASSKKPKQVEKSPEIIASSPPQVPKSETVRLNVELDRELYKRLKIFAIQTDTQISPLIRQLLEKHLPKA